MYERELKIFFGTNIYLLRSTDWLGNGQVVAHLSRELRDRGPFEDELRTEERMGEVERRIADLGVKLREAEEAKLWMRVRYGESNKNIMFREEIVVKHMKLQETASI